MNWLTQKRFLYLAAILMVTIVAGLSIGYILEWIPADEFQSYVIRTFGVVAILLLTAGIISFFAKPSED